MYDKLHTLQREQPSHCLQPVPVWKIDEIYEEDQEENGNAIQITPASLEKPHMFGGAQRSRFCHRLGDRRCDRQKGAGSGAARRGRRRYCLKQFGINAAILELRRNGGLASMVVKNMIF